MIPQYCRNEGRNCLKQILETETEIQHSMIWDSIHPCVYFSVHVLASFLPFHAHLNKYITIGIFTSLTNRLTSETDPNM